MSDDLRHFDELVQRYIEGTLDDRGARELMEALEGNPELGKQVVRELRMEALLRSEVPWVEEEIGRRLAEEFRRKEEAAEATVAKQPPSHFRWLRRMAAAAAVLLIVAGMLALWLIPSPAGPSWTVSKERRAQILEQLHELDLARAGLPPAVEDSTAGKTPEVPDPGAPSLDVIGQRARDKADAAQRKKDAEECARLLDRLRYLLQTELGGGRRREVPDEESGAPIVIADLPASDEAGRVVHVEGDVSSAVLVRAVDSQRTDLKAGEKLLCGDQIVVERGAHQASARIELKAGATIDLAAATTLKVVDRNAVRLEAGQVYACVNRPVAAEGAATYGAPFTLQTSDARYLMEDARVEVFASPPDQVKASTARVDKGQVHLLTGKGHVLGRKGQEIYAGAAAAPGRRDGFSQPIWRGRNAVDSGLSFMSKDNPVLFSNDNADQNFSAEYALALAHTGEIDLRGIQITAAASDKIGAGGAVTDPQLQRQSMVQEIDRLRQAGLRVGLLPVLGANQNLQRPASGRCEDTLPVRSPAVDQLLNEARKATVERPLVVVVSGAYTDVASAWLLDHEMSKRAVVITRNALPFGVVDSWAFAIVLENYRCVVCSVPFPRNGFQQFARLAGTRWHFLASRSHPGDTDFSQFACVTVPGFVKSTERVRFVRGASSDLTDVRFTPDPNGQTWLVKRTEDQLLVSEFAETFLQEAP